MTTGTGTHLLGLVDLVDQAYELNHERLDRDDLYQLVIALSTTFRVVHEGYKAQLGT